jgi:GLPGLI family protein
MKKITFILIVILSNTGFLAQKIQGRVTYIASTREIEGVSKNQKKELNQLLKNAKDVTCVLSFNSELSLYEVEEQMDIKDDKSLNIMYIFAGSSHKYYTYNHLMDFKNKQLNCSLLGECFLVQNKVPKWILTQETKQIQGFNCYKAILKNEKTNKIKLEAWYTPKIPYQYGIMDYYGLPGLILEINRNTYRFIAKKIELNPIEGVFIEKPSTKIKELTKEEFMKLVRKSSPEFFEKK